jgi:hypothetical protein
MTLTERCGMTGRYREVLAGFALLMYVLSSAGCAAGWFILGAGAAATTMAVVADNEEKSKTSDKTGKSKYE